MKMNKTIATGVIVATAAALAGCASFRGVSTVEPPPLWVVDISTDYLPSIVQFSAQIQCGGNVEIMRSIDTKADGGPGDFSNCEGQSALVTLTPSEADEVYRNAVRLLQRFRFQPKTIPSSKHYVSVRLLAGDTALQMHRGGFASPSEYPPEFRRIVALINGHAPKYISNKEILANIMLEGIP